MNRKVLTTILAMLIIVMASGLTAFAKDNVTDVALDGGSGHTHSGGTSYQNGGDGKHYLTCLTCGAKYDEQSHDISIEDYSDEQHKVTCSICGYVEYTFHVIEYTALNNTEHNMKCETCGHDFGNFNHAWTGGSYPTAHSCSDCNYVRNENDDYVYHSFANVVDGASINSNNLGKGCLLDGCNATLTIESNSFSSAEDFGGYKILGNGKYDETPISNGTEYSLKLNHIPCDINGNPVSGLKLDEGHLTLYPYTRGDYYEHYSAIEEDCEATIDRESYDALKKTSATLKKIVLLNLSSMLLGTKELIDWPKEAAIAYFEKIFEGDRITPTQSYSNLDGTIKWKYSGLDGRYLCVSSQLMGDQYMNGGLFVTEGVPEPTPPDVYARVYYCYRTTENEVPKNGYEYIYQAPDKAVIYKDGPKYDVPQIVSADLSKIDKTGYRYVGYIEQYGTESPATYGSLTGAGTTANLSMSFSEHDSVAIVTFFLEPVKLSYGHAATSHQNGLKDINATGTNHTGVIEFPECFNASKGYCEVEAKSLNKYFWPGYILNNCSVYEYNGGDARAYEGKSKYLNIKYTDDTTTNLTDRKTVSVSVKSSYSLEKGLGGSLKDDTGYARDKQLYFYYSLPETHIDHKDIDTNDFMQTTNGEDITYAMEVLHQFAYIDSLNTDNVNLPHTLRVDDISEGTKLFKYDASGYDLIQVEIYEINKNGTETLYGTLYNDDEYEPSKKPVKVNYSGVFERWYSESLNNLIISTRKDSQNFNTNKNWHIVFKYKEVPRLHVSFMDMKGNKLFLRDPENPGKYIGELSSKIPDSGTSYEITDLSEHGYSGYKPVVFTQDKNGYVRVSDLGEPAIIGQSISVPGKNGDLYIVIFYSNNKTVTVEFRDTNDNQLHDPKTLDIPQDTGAIINLPDVGDIDIIGYKRDDDYNDKSDDITYSGTNIPLTPLTSSDMQIPVPDNGNDQHVVVYYKAKPILKIEYRDTLENPIQVPPDYTSTKTVVISEEGVVIKVPDVSGYVVKYYKINENWTGDPNISGEGKKIQDGEVPVVPNGNSQHVIIYYAKQRGTLAITVEYRENTPTGRELHEKVTLQVPAGNNYVKPIDIPSYTPTKYIISGELEIKTIDAPTIKVLVDETTGNRTLIIIYEKVPTTTLRVEYQDESGEPLLPPKDMEIPVGRPTLVPPEDIPDYIPVYYKSGDSPTKHEEINNIVVAGQPGVPEKIIIVYRKEDTSRSGEVITPDDNRENIVLRANSQGAEEYNVDFAVPSSEDLYISGDIFGYRFVSEMELKEKNVKNIPVVIEQDYYLDVDDLSKKGTISTNTMNIDIDYNYFDIKKAELYDLKAIEVKNDAIKYYNGYNYDTDTKGIYQTGDSAVSIAVDKEIPSLYYSIPDDRVGQLENDRIQIKSESGYTVRKVGETYHIKLPEIAYEKPNYTQFNATYEQEGKSILEKCTFIKVQTLGIKMEGHSDLIILTGKRYNLPKKSEALNSETPSEYYIPYTDNRVPLYSFIENKDLYVKEEATNGLHLTEVFGNYRLIESIPFGTTTIVSHNPINGTRLANKPININPLNVHTPIVNGSSLKYGTDSSTFVQLMGTTGTSGSLATYEGNTVLNLDQTFVITIPNSGKHLVTTGYGTDKAYNHTGLTANGTEADAENGDCIVNSSRINHKSDNVLSKAKVVKEGGKWKIETDETEKGAIGPSFAEYKLVRFPFDVYLQPAGDDRSKFINGNPILLKANEWYNLYNFITPNTTEYTFALPIWVEDAKAYKDEDGIQVLVVAENCPKNHLENILNSSNIAGVTAGVTTAESNAADKTRYIIRKTHNVYVSGRVYDLQVRDSDDSGYMNKLKEALKLKKLPIAQKGQVKGYNLGLKLGYRFYFDLKTKGISNKSIKLVPKIYYVPTTGGTATDDISLFYKTKANPYNKLSENDLSVRMALSSTHGAIKNIGFTAETVSARRLNPKRILSDIVSIGKIVEGLILKEETEKLPFDCIVSEAELMGFDTRSGDFVTSAQKSEKIRDDKLDGTNDIKNALGHWYGEYYLPASTVVGNKTTLDKTTIANPENQYKTGYLIVTFEKITTGTDNTGSGYLTYDAPFGDTQWEKEEQHTNVTLPNGKTATVPTNGSAMAIYQVGLRANNDFETEGTH